MGVSVLRGQGVGLPTVKVSFWPGVRIQESKESKLQKALDATMKMISELKAKVTALTAELAEYKSIRGQLHTADLERENSELRGKLRKYEDVISRNNLWSYFSRRREKEIVKKDTR